MLNHLHNHHSRRYHTASSLFHLTISCPSFFFSPDLVSPLSLIGMAYSFSPMLNFTTSECIFSPLSQTRLNCKSDTNSVCVYKRHVLQKEVKRIDSRVKKKETGLTVVGFAVSGRDERVAGSTGALVTAGRVRAQLVTVTPVLALVQIDARPLIRWIDGHPLVTVANPSF